MLSVDIENEGLNEMFHSELMRQVDISTGTIDGVEPLERRMSDLAGCYADRDSWHKLAKENPLVYRLSLVEMSGEPGNMHYGLGCLYPGRVGSEFYFTRGHIHRKREAAEFYYCLSGKGAMLLQDEMSGACRLVHLGKHSIVYVPGYTAHRTINIGDEPLIYLGIYPADAGHDYEILKERDFTSIVIETPHGPDLISRKRYHKLAKARTIRPGGGK